MVRTTFLLTLLALGAGCAGSYDSAKKECLAKSETQQEYFHCMDEAGHFGNLSNHNEHCGVSGLYCAPKRGI